MTPEQLREWAGAIEGEKPWAPKVADVCDQLREHAAAIEEIERLNAAWKAQQFHLEAEERESAHWQERAEQAERMAERLKGLLAAAAKELPHCSGPVHERIAVYRREHAKQIEQAERRAERLKGHAEAMAEHMAKAIVVVGWPEEQSYGDEWSHDADRIIAAYRADKGE